MNPAIQKQSCPTRHSKQHFCLLVGGATLSLFLIIGTVATAPALGQHTPLFIPQGTPQLTPAGSTTVNRPVIPSLVAPLGTPLVQPTEPLAPLRHLPTTETVRHDEIEQVIRDGMALEAESRWSEVLAHYEAALRAHRNDPALMERFRVARFHSDVGRRFNDSSYLQLIGSLTPVESLHFFEEVITRIQEEHVEVPRWEPLFRHGIQSYTIAIADANFRARVNLDVSQEQLQTYLASVQTTVNGWTIRDREDMKNGLLHIAEGSQRQLGLNPTIVIMEFVCGVVSSLDPNTAFLTPNQYRSQYSAIYGNLVGLGVELRSDRESLLVIRVIPGSPAAETGLQPGDRILSVDGITTRGRDTDSAADLLQGAEGTAVKLSILSSGLGQRPRDVLVIRRQIDVPSVEDVRMLNDVLGYIKLTNFQTKTRAELTQALRHLEHQGMRVLVLDLRRNPGGLFNMGVDIASMFIEQGAIVRTQGRNLEVDAPSMTSGETWHVPLIVLIDEESASASEIFAGAIRDHGRGILIGRRTFGKGTIQKIIPVLAGSNRGARSGIKLTTEKFFSPLGWPYSGFGVAPHYPVPVRDDERHTVTRPVGSMLPLPPIPRPVTSSLDDPFIQEAVKVSQGMR